MNIIIKGKNKPPEQSRRSSYRQPEAKNRKVFFPKKSHHGYFDQQLNRRFYSEREKREFMNTNGILEGDGATRAHEKKIKDFGAWIKDEKRKDPNFVKTEQFKNEKYPD